MNDDFLLYCSSCMGLSGEPFPPADASFLEYTFTYACSLSRMVLKSVLRLGCRRGNSFAGSTAVASAKSLAYSPWRFLIVSNLC